MDLGLSGLASGFDWRTLVDQLADVERTPQTRLRTEQNTLQQRNSAFTSLKTLLNNLKSRVDTLKSAELFDSGTVQLSDATAASATVASGAPLGSYDFHFIQLATAAKQLGASDIAASLS